MDQLFCDELTLDVSASSNEQSPSLFFGVNGVNRQHSWLESTTVLYYNSSENLDGLGVSIVFHVSSTRTCRGSERGYPFFQLGVAKREEEALLARLVFHAFAAAFRPLAASSSGV